MSTLTATSWTTANKVGFGLAFVLALGNLPSLLFTTPDGEVGPPFAILLADTVLGVIAIVAVIVAWVRGSRQAARLAAIALVLIVVTALPAFFVDVPASIKALTGAVTVATVAACVLMLAPAKRP